MTEQEQSDRDPASFGGAVVVQFESRRSEELARLVRRHGGEPWLAPAVSEVAVDLTPSFMAREPAEAARELILGHVEAALFTTHVQVRHLIDVAREIGAEARLVDALRGPLVVGAVGPTCATALREHGVEPNVVPEHPKMGHLVLAMARAMAGALA